MKRKPWKDIPRCQYCEVAFSSVARLKLHTCFEGCQVWFRIRDVHLDNAKTWWGGIHPLRRNDE